MNRETIPVYPEFIDQRFVDMAQFKDIELDIISESPNSGCSE